jgi:hypothetical protein
MDAIAGWGSFSNEQKQGALEDAAKRKEEHERLYSRATRLVNTATSTAASLVSKMEQRPPPKKKEEEEERRSFLWRTIGLPRQVQDRCKEALELN